MGKSAVSYTKRAVRGASITLIFSVLASVVAYLTRLVLARNLSTEDYGLFYAVFTFVIFFLFFRDLGLGQALVKFISQYQVEGKYNHIKTAIFSVFTLQFLSSVIFVIVFFFLADYLAVSYFKDPQAGIILKILTVYVIFSIFFILVKQTFLGFQRMFLFSSVEFMKNLIVLISIFLFFKFSYQVFSPVYAFAIVCPLLFLIYLPFFLKTFHLFKYKIVNFSRNSKKLLVFGIPIFATSVGGRIIGYVDTLILTGFGTLTEVGVYNAVLPSALIFLFFSKAISSVVFPMSSELWAKNDKTRISKGLGLIHRYIFFLIAPMILMIIFYSRFLINLLFGSEYVVGSFAFQVLLVGVMFYVVASINNSIIVGIGKPKTVTAVILSSALFNLIFNFLLIPLFGINGAAFATTISYLLMLIFSTYKVTRYIGTTFPYKEWLKLIFPTACFFGMVVLVNKSFDLNIWLEMLLSFVIAGIVYLLLLYILKLINIKEIRHYLRLAK